MAPIPPTPLSSAAAVKKACRPPRAQEVLKATDCRVVAELPGEQGLWISSPNMNIVPCPVVDRAAVEITYYADGMLGPYELSKWPQTYDQSEPHWMAVPGRPSWCESSRADHKVIPPFDRPDVPWLGFAKADFYTSLELPDAEIGTLAPELLMRCRDAAKDAVSQATRVCEQKYGTREDLSESECKARTGRRRFALERMSTMWRALTKLEEVPLPSFQVLAWFREFQRLLLELRGWLIYETIIAARLQDPEVDERAHVLPVRGVVTSRVGLVDDLYRIGIPVWWVRPLYTLTTETAIYRAVEPELWTRWFSGEKTMIHGKHSMPAPVWGHHETIQPFGESLAYQLRRFSLSSQPRVAKMLPVWDEPDAEPPNAESRDEEPVDGPSGSRTTDASSRGHRKRKHTSRKGKEKCEVPPPPPTAPTPSWLQPACQGWNEALSNVKDLRCDQAAHGQLAFLYPLPPPQMFYGEGTMQAHKVQNWTRIRLWCLTQALAPPKDARVLMTTTQWRIALEGAYYSIPPECLKVKPQASPEDIARLPIAPVAPKRPRGDGSGNTRRNLKRLADRADIAVRFALTAGIPPFQPDTTIGTWGSLQVTRQVAETDEALRAEITWELSLLNFRLELLALDRALLLSLYSEDNGRHAYLREMAIRDIWSPEQAVKPPWALYQAGDQLSLPEAEDRMVAVSKWASVMSAWPGGVKVAPPVPPIQTQHAFDKRAFRAWEVIVVEFYCRSFHARYARLPTTPLRAPPSILDRAPPV